MAPKLFSAYCLLQSLLQCADSSNIMDQQRDQLLWEQENGGWKDIVCPRSGSTLANVSVNGFDPVRRYTEVSGLALSPTQTSPESGEPIMYVVNDGSDDYGGRIGVYDSGTGLRLLTLTISNQTVPSNYDWEALTIGPCGVMPSNDDNDDTDSSCLYIADVGDNVARNTKGRRTDRTDTDPYRILKIREPVADQLLFSLGENDTDVAVPDSDVFMLAYDYSHASSPTKFADCEAVFVDPIGWGYGGSPGDLYTITKWNSQNLTLTRLFKIPIGAWSIPTVEGLSVQRNEDTTTINKMQHPPMYSPRAVGRYSSADDLLQTKWTGADLTKDGTVIALSGYDGTSLFLRCPGSTVAEALTGSAQKCHSFYHPSPGQVETSAWNSDGTKHLEIPEGPRPTMGWTTMVYEKRDTLREQGISTSPLVCPRLEWVVQKDLQKTCRTVDDQSPKPDAWCHHSTSWVPQVHYLDDITAPNNRNNTTSQAVSYGWQPALLLTRTLVLAVIISVANRASFLG